VVALKRRFNIIAVTTVLILCVTSQIALASAAAAYQDEFTSGTLQSFWTFTAGTGSYSLTAHSDYLRLTAPNGAKLSTITGSNLNAPRMLQSVTGNLEATTYVTGSFSSANYRGGLLLWANEQNFIRLEKYGSTQALMYPIINGVESSPKTVTGLTSSNTLYLKLQKTGSTVTCSYSTTGASYTTIGTCSFSLSDPLYIGLFAINADNSASSFSADFDYFHIYPYSDPLPSVLPEYPVGIFGATAAIAGAYVFFKAKSKVKPVVF
jgi:regulation of enolase protein 1 (concanavalin A-like superfamily)